MPDDNLIGQQLDEYRVEALLGQGGMARVYRGLDTRLDRYAAIKVIDAPLRTDSEYVMRFEREAQAIAKLEHPHIVRLYRYGEAYGVLYMAMQYIEGSDLESVLRSYHDDQEFIEPEDALRIITEVCRALDYAHGKGVIHRDVKPSNIMLDKQGQAYLADFGLALLTDIGTRGEIFGSPHYIAPEQAISSAGAVPQSDLYAVGVMLYEMFTGQYPFDDDTPMDIAMKHMSDPPPPLRGIRSEIDPALERVVLKALEKDPEKRYSNGGALAEALEQALVKSPVPAPAGTTLPRKSIPDRVALDFAANPLPPIPAEVVTPKAAPTLTYPVSAPPPMVVEPIKTQKSRRPIYVGAFIVVLLAIAAIVLFLLSGGDDADDETELALARDLTKTVLFSASETEEAALILTPTQTSAAVSIPSLIATLPTMTPFPTSTALVLSTSVMASIPLPTATSTPTAAPTLTPFPTVTPAPTLTPVLSTATAMTSASTQSDYTILIATHKEDSLFVINQGEMDFLLSALRLEGDRGSIDGSEWGVSALQSGQCVAAWKSNGNPKSPDVDCDLVGEHLTRGGKERFWKSSFEVFYGDQMRSRCSSDRCSISISG